jgi:N6-adenosine-specific RNA methylase IME4
MFTDIFSTDKKYQIIYADPPWRYQDRKCNGAYEWHYDTMKITDICELPVKSITADDCVLFLWTTYPMLREAMELIEAWGFTYKTIGFQWVKQNKTGKGFFFGLGRWTRGNTEPCLIAVKGKPKRISASVSQLIFSPVGKHSAKPPIVRKKIVELMGGISRIELFARQTAEGWDCWGDQAPQDNEPAEVETPAALQTAREQINGQESIFEYLEECKNVKKKVRQAAYVARNTAERGADRSANSCKIRDSV